MTSLREKRVLAADEVATLLGQQVAIDARAAGWLTPCPAKLAALRAAMRAAQGQKWNRPAGDLADSILTLKSHA